MPASVACRRFLRIVGAVALIGFISLAAGVSARAQTVVPSTYDPATMLLSTIDTAISCPHDL